jgi:hypothetical protein
MLLRLELSSSPFVASLVALAQTTQGPISASSTDGYVLLNNGQNFFSMSYYGLEGPVSVAERLDAIRKVSLGGFNTLVLADAGPGNGFSQLVPAAEQTGTS